MAPPPYSSFAPQSSSSGMLQQQPQDLVIPQDIPFDVKREIQEHLVVRIGVSKSKIWAYFAAPKRQETNVNRRNCQARRRRPQRFPNRRRSWRGRVSRGNSPTKENSEQPSGCPVPQATTRGSRERREWARWPDPTERWAPRSGVPNGAGNWSAEASGARKTVMSCVVITCLQYAYLIPVTIYMSFFFGILILCTNLVLYSLMIFVIWCIYMKFYIF